MHHDSTQAITSIFLFLSERNIEKNMEQTLSDIQEITGILKTVLLALLNSKTVKGNG